MPPLPPAPNVILVQYRFTYSNDTNVQCRVHVSFTSAAPTAADLSTMATHQITNAGATWASEMGSEVTLTQVTCTDLTSPSGKVGLSTGSTPGTRAGAELPASTAVLWNQKVDRRYRGGKPRVYLPWGVDTDLVDAQHWSTAALSSFQSGLGNIINALQVQTFGALVTGTLQNVSYYQGSTAVTSGAGTKYERGKTVPTVRPATQIDAISGNSINPRPGTQRRRLLFSS